MKIATDQWLCVFFYVFVLAIRLVAVCVRVRIEV